MSNIGKWTVSTSSDLFNGADYFDTKQEAIDFGRLEYKEYVFVNEFYVGQIQSVSLGVCVDTDSILERINESMCDEFGELAGDYLMRTDPEHDAELEEELTKVIVNWIEKHNYQPTFFTVESIEKVEV